MHDVYQQWLVCGDAIADPLTGIHASLAGWASWLAGGGQLLELSLEGTVRHCISATAPPDGDFKARQAHWQQHLDDNGIIAAAPLLARKVVSSAR